MVTNSQAAGLAGAALAYAGMVEPHVYPFAGRSVLGLRSRLTNEHLVAALTPDQIDGLIDGLTAVRDALTPARPVLRRERRDGTGGRRSTDTAA